jgi:hypothetical protein
MSPTFRFFYFKNISTNNKVQKMASSDLKDKQDQACVKRNRKKKS